MKRQECLVTTSIMKTWDKSAPNKLLGLWAVPSPEKKCLNGYKYELINANNNSVKSRDANFFYIQKLSLSILNDVIPILNNVNCCDYSSRFWNILLGHWLQRYVSSLLFRYQRLRSALLIPGLTHTYIIERKQYEFSALTSLDFILRTNDQHWNHHLFGMLLKRMSHDIECLTLKSKIDATLSPEKKQNTLPPNQFKIITKKTLQTVSRTLMKHNDAVIVKPYLPKKVELFLHLSLGQLPLFHTSAGISLCPEDKSLRSSLKTEFGFKTNDFEGIARELLFDFIPRCFLEKFSELKILAEQQNLPKNPKFIFTSNNFDTDEVFKFWVGTKVEKGVPYIVGQHGSAYGTHKYLLTKFGPEMTTSDRFLTWGWCCSQTREMPMFLLKTAGQKFVGGKVKRSLNNYSRLMLVMPLMPHFVHHWDSLRDFNLNQKFQINFVQSLPENIKKNLVVRLHHLAEKREWSDKKRWYKNIPDVEIDDGHIDILKLAKTNRLTIFAYDSAGFLEFLSLGIPCICLWHGGLDHLLVSAQSDYEELVSVGLIHLNASEAADWLDCCWNSVDEWWLSEAVKDARQTFCNKYAKFEDQPVRKLKRALLSIKSVTGLSV
ncbi:LIC12162 family protein [Candidatus Puniceispirillum sp.]|nr:LIC12162 family protein [Candidatus Puniceispirillum sp.]